MVKPNVTYTVLISSYVLNIIWYKLLYTISYLMLINTFALSVALMPTSQKHSLILSSNTYNMQNLGIIYWNYSPLNAHIHIGAKIFRILDRR